MDEVSRVAERCRWLGNPALKAARAFSERATGGNYGILSARVLINPQGMGNRQYLQRSSHGSGLFRIDNDPS
jgi:hypothetical protein